MHKTKRLSFLTFTVVTFLCAFSGPNASAKNDVIIVPARQRMVALAFDIQSLRDLVMITYRGTTDTEQPLLHVWEPKTKAWRELSSDGFSVGQFMSSQPDTIYLVGTENSIPKMVIEGAAQARTVVRIDSISIAEVVNTLDQTMKFSESEWAALQERHGLQTRDLNYERRKWGRFGPPPGTVKASDEPAVQEEVPVMEAPSADHVEPLPEATEATAEDQASTPFVMDNNASQPLAPDEAPAVVAEAPVRAEKGSAAVEDNRLSTIATETPVAPSAGSLSPEDK